MYAFDEQYIINDIKGQAHGVKVIFSMQLR
jgi:hypothetical protein